MAAQPMYPTNLQDIFNQGNYSVLPEVMQQQATAQRQAEQNLALSGQTYDTNAQKLPLELEGLRATNDLHGAQAGHARAQTTALEDDNRINASIPLADRIAMKMAPARMQMSQAQAAEATNHYRTLGGVIAAANANRGQIPVPLAMQLGQTPQGQAILQTIQRPNGLRMAQAALDGWIQADTHYRTTMDREAAHGATQEKIEGMRKTERDEARKERAQAKLNADMNGLTKLKPVEQYVSLAGKIAEYRASGDDDLIKLVPRLESRLVAIEPAAKADWALRQQANKAKMDWSQAKEGILQGLPEIPFPTDNAKPPAQPASAASSPQGMSEADIIKAYRAAGTVATRSDEEILQDARSKGYIK